MLGTVQRFTIMQSGNFMPKWIEISQQGISYFKSAAAEKPQAFYPKACIKDVKVVRSPENA